MAVTIRKPIRLESVDRTDVSLTMSSFRKEVNPSTTKVFQGIQELVQFCLTQDVLKKGRVVQSIISSIHSNLTIAREISERYFDEYDRQICSTLDRIGQLENQVRNQKEQRNIKRMQLEKMKEKLESVRQSHERCRKSFNKTEKDIENKHAQAAAFSTARHMFMPLALGIPSALFALESQNKREQAAELTKVLRHVEEELQALTSEKRRIERQLEETNEQKSHIENELRQIKWTLAETKRNRDEICQFGESITKIHTIISSLHGKGEVLHRSNRDDYISIRVLLSGVKDIVEDLITEKSTSCFSSILDPGFSTEYYRFLNCRVGSITAKINHNNELAGLTLQAGNSNDDCSGVGLFVVVLAILIFIFLYPGVSLFVVLSVLVLCFMLWLFLFYFNFFGQQ